MKKTIIAICISMFSTLSIGQIDENNSLDTIMEISGIIQKEADWIYLKQFNGKKRVITDSSKVVNNKFNFKLTLDEPQMIYLCYSERENVPIFVENAKISVQIPRDAESKPIISGANSHDVWRDIEFSLNKFDVRLDSIYRTYKEIKSKSDTSGLAKVEKDYDREDENKLIFINQYIKENPNSYQSAFLATRFYAFSRDQQVLEDFVELFEKHDLKSIYIQSLRKRIADLNKIKIGTLITDFEQFDNNGKVIHIKDFRGQYVLIDFWASWCGPCRRENPNIVKAYQSFKNDNFTVLGVSLDTDKKKWLSAIEKDNLVWIHISDLKGWNNEVANLFGVKSIPFSILIDPEGTILATGLKGEELVQFLKINLNR